MFRYNKVMLFILRSFIILSCIIFSAMVFIKTDNINTTLDEFHMEQLVNRKLKFNYKYSNDNPICSNFPNNARNIFFFAILSARYNFERRQGIRKTWGSMKELGYSQARFVFIVGQKGDWEDEESELQLKNEFSEYQDLLIVQDYEDTYRNLVYKTLVGAQFFVDHCMDAHWFVKIDDDNYIFMNTLLLGVTWGLERENFIFCLALTGNLVDRNESSKWFISKSDLEREEYPDYCWGNKAYIISSDAVDNLLSVVPINKIISIEDAYFTGILRESYNNKGGKIFIKNITKYGEHFIWELTPFVQDEIYRIWNKLENHED